MLPYNVIERRSPVGALRLRVHDGFFDVAHLCRLAGRRWNEYLDLPETQTFLALQSMHRRGVDLVDAIRSDDPDRRGVFVSPEVSVNAAHWLGPDYASAVIEAAFDWSRTASPLIESPSIVPDLEPARPAPVMPFHLRRYCVNAVNVPPGHFSCLTEMARLLIGPLEMEGYSMPESLWPDISMGRCFCAWLRVTHGVVTDDLPVYLHAFEDRPAVRAKAFPEQLLPLFWWHFREVWLPHRSMDYFAKRDQMALVYLPILIARNAKPVNGA